MSANFAPILKARDRHSTQKVLDLHKNPNGQIRKKKKTEILRKKLNGQIRKIILILKVVKKGKTEKDGRQCICKSNDKVIKYTYDPIR